MSIYGRGKDGPGKAVIAVIDDSNYPGRLAIQKDGRRLRRMLKPQAQTLLWRHAKRLQFVDISLANCGQHQPRITGHRIAKMQRRKD